MAVDIVSERLGPIADLVGVAVGDLIESDAVARMWAGDHTLWQEDPTEVADRLGWLPVVAEVAAEVADLEAFADEVAAAGMTRAVVLGMGGSSLFPEVLARSFPSTRLELLVLDTTDPAAIARVGEGDLERTLFISASKSGGTLETASQTAHFFQLTGGAGDRFVAITDPGTALAGLARERGFRRVFENRPDIGGRYSALSYFGMVPGALMGAPVADLLAAATEVARATGPDADASANPALRLGAILGAATRAGRDKATLVLPEGIATFGLWVEQLFAESSGKQATGYLPVAGEPLAADPATYGDDRFFLAVGSGHAGLDELAEAGHPVVELSHGGALDIGGLVLLLEEAVALSGVVLGTNPFDQPDVAAAKAATNRVLEEGLTDLAPSPLTAITSLVRPGDYLAIHAYVDPGDEALLDRLQASRVRLRDELGVATTLGVGPRFLHSTGQYHKGGPPTGVFVQVVGDDPDDLAIPDQAFTFSTFKRSQAEGDLATLHERGLRAGRVALDELLDFQGGAG